MMDTSTNDERAPLLPGVAITTSNGTTSSTNTSSSSFLSSTTNKTGSFSSSSPSPSPSSSLLPSSVSSVSSSSPFSSFGFIKWVILAFTAFYIIFITIYQVDSNFEHSHGITPNKNYNTTTGGNEDEEQLYFDYIIVGAGPSGIVAAYNLAQRLYNEGHEDVTIQSEPQNDRFIKSRTKTTIPNVLLIESGDMSQLNVMKTLYKKNYNKKEYNYQSKQTPSSSSTAAAAASKTRTTKISNENTMEYIHQHYQNDYSNNDFDPCQPVFVNSNSSLDMNMFDIPLLWNSLSIKNTNQSSSSDDHHLSSSSLSSLPNYLLHHWPVKKTFLGRAVGGCGIHNAMINVRALPSDFEKWNITNWSANVMMPYYNKLESYNDSYKIIPKFWSNNKKNYYNRVMDETFINQTQFKQQQQQQSQQRGKDGPLNTIVAGTGEIPIDPVASLFIESSLAAGYPLSSLGFNNDDSNRVGVGYYEFNIRNGVRDSVASALLSNGGGIDDDDDNNNNNDGGYDHDLHKNNDDDEFHLEKENKKSPETLLRQLDYTDEYVKRKYPPVPKTPGTMFATEFVEVMKLDVGEHAYLAEIMDRQWRTSTDYRH